MRAASFMLACLSHAGRGRRLQLSHEQRQHSLKESFSSVGLDLEQHAICEISSCLEALAMHLLASKTPEAGFQVLGSGCNLAMMHLVRSPAGVPSVVPCLTDVTTALPERADVPMGSEMNEKLDRVLQVLAADIPEILHKDLTWEIFAEDFKVLDQTGGQVEGLEASMLFTKLLRRMNRKFAVNDDIRVHFSVSPSGLLVSQWQVLFSTRRPRLLFWRKEASVCIDMDVEAVFHLNEKQEVDYMKLNKWLVNGQELKSWPTVKVLDKPSRNRAKMERWAQEIRRLGSVDSSQDGCVVAYPSDEKRFSVDGVSRSKPIFSRRLRFLDRLLDVVLERIVDRLLDRIFDRVGQEDLDRVVDRVLDRVLDRASDRVLEPVWSQTGWILPQARRKAGLFDARDGLQADLPAILSREPNWEYVAGDFKLIDQTGFTVQIGLTPTKALLYLLRQLHNGLTGTPLRDKLLVQTEKTFEPGPDGAPEPVLMAQWTLEIELNKESQGLDISTLEELRSVYLPFIPQDYGLPILVAGKFMFNFNKDRELDSMKVDSWSINGNELMLNNEFPFLSVRKVD